MVFARIESIDNDVEKISQNPIGCKRKDRTDLLLQLNLLGLIKKTLTKEK